MEWLGRILGDARDLLRDLRHVDPKKVAGVVMIAAIGAEPVSTSVILQWLWTLVVALFALGVLRKPLQEARDARQRLERDDAAEVARIREAARDALPEYDDR